VRGEGETSAWLASLVRTVGVTAAVVTLGGACTATGGVYYGARHGFPAQTVAALHEVGTCADFISMAALGGCALASRSLPRWLAGLSLAVGVVGVVGVVGGTGPAELGLATVVWLGWLVILAVVLLRGPARTPRVVGDVTPESALAGRA
jgi:hypothetical protein